MTEKLPCGRPSTCELCSRCLLAEMLFQGRTWLPHPSMSWVGGLTTLSDRVQGSREGARARVSPYDWYWRLVGVQHIGGPACTRAGRLHRVGVHVHAVQA